MHSAAELSACMTPPTPTANSDPRTIKAGPARHIQPCPVYHPARGYYRLLFDPVLYFNMIVSDAFLILLLACIAAYSSHLLLLEYAEAKLPRWMRNHQILCCIPIMSVCLSIAVVIASALTKPSGSPQCSEDSEINADIGGIGVLLGLFLPSALLVVVLLSGHWKAEPSGAKELCMAHMASMEDCCMFRTTVLTLPDLLYLTVNLAKSNNEISIRDTLVACSSIDAISASISMAISDKDVLAARKLVMFSYILHVPAFVIEGITLSRLSRFPSQCLTELRHPTISSSRAMMWTYFAVRIMTALAPTPTVWRLIPRLNEIEHAPRQSQQVKDARNWECLPATLFTNYIVFGSLALIQIGPTLSITQATLFKSAEKLRNEWGQSAALIVAVVSISHVVFSFACLFRSEASRHRLEVCQINRTTTIWASPEWTWRTGFLWKFLKQRSPFEKVALRPADELLADAVALVRITELNLSLEEQDVLWQELLDAFSNNDAIYVLDCLDRGAPVNRSSEEREFPIHMAARLGNMDVVHRIHPPVVARQPSANGVPVPRISPQKESTEMLDLSKKGFSSDPFQRLISKNADGLTPLNLAVNANRTQTVKWLLQRMLEIPSVSKENNLAAQNSVVAAMRSVIMAEKIELLETIHDAWPRWESLHLSDLGNMCHPCQFALYWGKPKSADFIISKTTPPYFEPHFAWKFKVSRFWKALEADTVADRLRWFEFLWQHIPDLATNKHFRHIGVTNGFIRPLLAMGWCPDKLCNLAVNGTNVERALFITQYPSEALPSLSIEALDCVRSNIRNAAEEDRLRWEAVGARDWSQFLQAVRHADTNSLTTLIAAESALPDGEVSRMVNSIASNAMQGDRRTLSERAITCVALSTHRNAVTDVDNSVALLLQHGASVLNSSPVANSSLMDVLTNSRKGLVHNDHGELYCLTIQTTTLTLLLNAAAREDANLQPRNDSALHTVCKALENNYRTVCKECVRRCVKSLQVLLHSGCDARSTNGDGMTPRDILENLSKDLSPSGFGGIGKQLKLAVRLLQASEKPEDAMKNADQYRSAKDSGQQGLQAPSQRAKC